MSAAFNLGTDRLAAQAAGEDATPGQAVRDPQTEQDHAEWLGWMEANAYSTHPDDCEGMAEAFAAGMRAQRDLAAREPQPAPGTWTISEVLERNGDLSGTLHEIMRAYTPGTIAHDEAHAALDRSRVPQPAPADAVPDLLLDRMDKLDRIADMCRRPADVAGRSSGSGIVSGTNLAAAILRVIEEAR